MPTPEHKYILISFQEWQLLQQAQCQLAKEKSTVNVNQHNWEKRKNWLKDHTGPATSLVCNAVTCSNPLVYVGDWDAKGEKFSPRTVKSDEIIGPKNKYLLICLKCLTKYEAWPEDGK